jgi:ribosome-binding factor A
MSIRPQRVASLLKEELGAVLVKEYAGQLEGLTTVTEVRLSPDLRVARIYVSIFGNAEVRERTMEFLTAELPHIRGLLGSRIRIRFMPELHLHMDQTLDHVDRINAIIKKIHDEKPDDNPPE